MTFFRRGPWLPILALLLYVWVNVGERALHHHDHGSACAADHVPAAHPADISARTPSVAADADDDESTCPLCGVLHLAQSSSFEVTCEANAPLTGQVVAAAPSIRPYPLESSARSRAPPRS